jgi:hypothetical protein
VPTIAALLTHPFFNSTELAYSHHLTNPSQSDRPHLKFSSHVKEALKVARQKIEIRLKDEQKMVQRITSEYLRHYRYAERPNKCVIVSDVIRNK